MLHEVIGDRKGPDTLELMIRLLNDLPQRTSEGREKRLDLVIEIGKEMLKMEPSDDQVYELLGNAYLRKHDATSAFVAFKSAQASNPRSAYIALMVGRLTSDKGEKLIAYEKAASLKGPYAVMGKLAYAEIMKDSDSDTARRFFEIVYGHRISGDNSSISKVREPHLSERETRGHIDRIYKQMGWAESFKKRSKLKSA